MPRDSFKPLNWGLVTPETPLPPEKSKQVSTEVWSKSPKLLAVTEEGCMVQSWRGFALAREKMYLHRAGSQPCSALLWWLCSPLVVLLKAGSQPCSALHLGAWCCSYAAEDFGPLQKFFEDLQLWRATPAPWRRAVLMACCRVRPHLLMSTHPQQLLAATLSHPVHPSCRMKTFCGWRRLFHRCLLLPA